MQVVSTHTGLEAPSFHIQLIMQVINELLDGGFKYFLFSPLFAEMIPFDQYFSNGWFNHQLDYIWANYNDQPAEVTPNGGEK